MAVLVLARMVVPAAAVAGLIRLVAQGQRVRGVMVGMVPTSPTPCRSFGLAAVAVAVNLLPVKMQPQVLTMPKAEMVALV
jgi:hypothetical protein